MYCTYAACVLKSDLENCLKKKWKKSQKMIGIRAKVLKFSNKSDLHFRGWHCIVMPLQINVGQEWYCIVSSELGNYLCLWQGREFGGTDTLQLNYHVPFNMLMFIIYLSFYFHFLFTAAGMAGPLHGAWSERPAEVSVLQCGVKCSGSARCSPGPADQGKAISWRTALLSGEHQQHHTPPSGAEPSPPDPSTNCTALS